MRSAEHYGCRQDRGPKSFIYHVLAPGNAARRSEIPVDRLRTSAEHGAFVAMPRNASAMCPRLEKPIYPGALAFGRHFNQKTPKNASPWHEAKIRAQLLMALRPGPSNHINLQGVSNESSRQPACDAVVFVQTSVPRSLAAFIGNQGQNECPHQPLETANCHFPTNAGIEPGPRQTWLIFRWEYFPPCPPLSNAGRLNVFVQNLFVLSAFAFFTNVSSPLVPQ